MPGGTPCNTLLDNHSPIAHRTRKRLAADNSEAVSTSDFQAGTDISQGVAGPVVIDNTSVNTTTFNMATPHSYGPKFTGTDLTGASDWIDDLLTIMTVAGVAEDKQLNVFRLQLDCFARDWFKTLPADKKDTIEHAVAAFKEHFALPPSQKTEARKKLHSLQQAPNQSGRVFAQNVIQMARPLDMSEDDMLSLIKGNLHPNIKLLVEQANPTTLESLLKQPACQVLPEGLDYTPQQQAPVASVQTRQDEVGDIISQFKDLLNLATSAQPAKASNQHRPQQQKPRHQQPRSQGPPGKQWTHGPQPSQYQYQAQAPPANQYQYHTQGPQANHFQYQGQQKPCMGCGKSIPLHKKRCFKCPASFIPCNYCNIPGHFDTVCQKKTNFSYTPNNGYPNYHR